MMNWYDLPGALDGFESNPAYLEKLAVDSEEEIEGMDRPSGKRVTQTSCSWVKKRRYKKKMVRRFLSINPDLDYSSSHGMRCCKGYYIHDEHESFPRHYYTFNRYTKVYLSRRGDLRKFNGQVVFENKRLSLWKKDKTVGKLTNRRIHYNENYGEACRTHSYCKKLYGSWPAYPPVAGWNIQCVWVCGEQRFVIYWF